MQPAAGFRFGICANCHEVSIANHFSYRRARDKKQRLYLESLEKARGKLRELK